MMESEDIPTVLYASKIPWPQCPSVPERMCGEVKRSDLPRLALEV
jgi:hypothetical protein